MQKEFNKFLGEPEIVGRINSAAEMPKNNLKEENPHASFLTDIMRKKYDTDIALINAGTIRGAFSSGDISTRDIGEIFPFKDKIAVIDITEEKLVQAVKYCATALKQEDGKPGLLQVSGIRYSVSDDGELRSEERRVGKECRSRWSPYH